MERFAPSVVLVALVACASSPPRTEPPKTDEAAPVEPASKPANEPEPHDDTLPAYVPPPDPPYVPPPAGAAPRLPPAPVASPEEVKACAARGGKMEPVCMLGSLECVIRYRDAGKRCTDKKDCAGDCVYEGPHPIPANPVGKCERTSDPCGCKAKMIRGKVQPAMCVD